MKGLGFQPEHYSLLAPTSNNLNSKVIRNELYIKFELQSMNHDNFNERVFKVKANEAGKKKLSLPPGIEPGSRAKSSMKLTSSYTDHYTTEDSQVWTPAVAAGLLTERVDNAVK